MSMAEDELPLSAVRILDITVVWAGPFATMLLADLGADVIRVESLQHFPSSTRGTVGRPSRQLVARMGLLGRSYVDMDPSERPWNRHAMFNAHARNKRSMTLDLERDEGKKIFQRLVGFSDVLIENNSAGTMPALGLTYGVLKKSRPDLIMISMPGFGTTGPYAHFRGYGANTEAVAGLTLLRGYPDLDPTSISSTFHMDAASGAAAAFATIAALQHRRRTGEGQFIEFAQAENLIAQIGAAILDQQMNNRTRTSLGNRDASRSPHGVYPCRPGPEANGADRWIAIAVETDAQFKALCRAMRKPELATDRRFRTLVGRRRHSDTLDALISAWTQDRDDQTIFELLQALGVPAGPVLSNRAAHSDPGLLVRQFFHEVSQDDAGTHSYPGFPWNFGHLSQRFRLPPCRLGEHNLEIYRDLLGLPDSDINALRASGHIGGVYDGF